MLVGLCLRNTVTVHLRKLSSHNFFFVLGIFNPVILVSEQLSSTVARQRRVFCAFFLLLLSCGTCSVPGIGPHFNCGFELFLFSFPEKVEEPVRIEIEEPPPESPEPLPKTPEPSKFVLSLLCAVQSQSFTESGEMSMKSEATCVLTLFYQ